MRLAFVLDPLESLDPCVDSTVGMMEAAQRRGHDVWVAEARDLAVLDGRAQARLRRSHLATNPPVRGCRTLVARWWERS